MSINEQVKSDIDLSKRNFFVVGGAAALGTLVLGSSACEKKDVDFYIATVTGSLTQLKPLLPNQIDLLNRAISIAREVNSAYQDGKFDSALGLANSLTATIESVIIAAGVNLSDAVKMILSIANVALGTVAVLIGGSAPGRMASAGNIRVLASPARVNAIFTAARLQ